MRITVGKLIPNFWEICVREVGDSLRIISKIADWFMERIPDEVIICCTDFLPFQIHLVVQFANYSTGNPRQSGKQKSVKFYHDIQNVQAPKKSLSSISHRQ
jgi:hypothetical protein